MMHPDFRVSVGDDQEHEDLTAEIYFRDEFVAMISQEQGLDRADLCLYARNSGEPWSFKLKEFINILNEASERLWELRRVSNSQLNQPGS